MYILIFIAALLFLSAFFSLSETGITGANRGKIYKLKLEGNKRANKVISLLDKKDKLITTILLGNTAVMIAASSLTTVFLIQMFGDTPEIIFYATILMTLIILIFSEVLPKVFALKNAERVALATAPIISLLVRIFYPVTFIVDIIVSFVLRIFGLERNGLEGVAYGLGALRGALELYHEEGDVVKDDKDMLGGVIDLDETEVNEVMQHRKDMEAIDISLSNEEIIKEVLKSQYSRIPVYSGSPENIIGILHTKSLMRALADFKSSADLGMQEGMICAPLQLNIKSILMEPWFVPDSTTLKEQLIAFREKRQHFALVVDEYGSLMGMITLEDILEEIVGNIHDEYDTDYLNIEDNLDGTFIIDGTIPVRDLNREMHWNLPNDIANTVAGLIIAEAQMIPKKEQIFNFYGFRFEILKKKRNQITKVKVSKVA